MPALVHTIGHSNHETDTLLALLGEHGIEAVADVRSSPFSRFNPQFNRPALKASLDDAGLRYVFLGEELGARRSEPECYVGERAEYDRIATTDGFKRGVDRVVTGAGRMRIALLCSEHDPLTCHRTILIARHLVPLVDGIEHILRDGSIETHAAAEERLLAECRLDEPDLFTPPEERLADAYQRRAAEIAYVEVAADG